MSSKKAQDRSAAQLDEWRIYAAERASVHEFLASLTLDELSGPGLPILASRTQLPTLD